LNIEKRHQVSVLILANPHIQRPQYHINRIKEDNAGKHKKASYTLIQQPELQITRTLNAKDKSPEPAVKSSLAKTSCVTSEGFLKRLWERLFGQEATTEKTKQVQQTTIITPEKDQEKLKLMEKKPHNNHNRRKRHPSGSQHGGVRHQPHHAQNAQTSGQPSSHPHPQHNQQRKRPPVNPTAKAPKVDSVNKKEPNKTED
jgi:ribonuclease E